MSDKNQSNKQPSKLQQAEPVESSSLMARLAQAKAECEDGDGGGKRQVFDLGLGDYSETPTIELQRLQDNTSGIQPEGSADDMRRAIELMHEKKRRSSEDAAD